MLETIEGIILKKLPYNDNSTILYIYTPTHGFLATLIKKNSSPKNNHAAYIMPLSIVHAQIKVNASREMQFISKLSSDYYLLSLRESYDKMNIAYFLSELLYQILKYPHADKKLYNFLKEWILKLDRLPEELCVNTHLYALIRLLSFLGIEPENNFSQQNCYFDLKQACFTDRFTKEQSENKDISYFWNIFLYSTLERLLAIKISREHKFLFIKSILKYCTLHLDMHIDETTLTTLQAIYHSQTQNA